jgi:hypothetical protein
MVCAAKPPYGVLDEEQQPWTTSEVVETWIANRTVLPIRSERPGAAR